MRIIVTFLLLIFFNSTFSCECKTYPITNNKTQDELFIEDSFKNSTFIFYGEFLGNGTFKILKKYKNQKSNRKIKTITEKSEKTTCDETFFKNIKYLIFGRINKEGKLFTSVCYANRQIKSRKDLKFIKKYLKSST